MLFKHKDRPIFNIRYYHNGEYDIQIDKNLSEQDIQNIGSFIFLLTYQSPISIEIIEKLKQIKDDKNQQMIDSILNAWGNYYLNDKHKPMVEPLLAFSKNNVK